MRRWAVLLMVTGLLASCEASGPSKQDLSDLATFCADLGAAASQPYDQEHYLSMQRDFPFSSDMNGYEIANRLVNMYNPDPADASRVNPLFVAAEQAYVQAGPCTNP